MAGYRAIWFDELEDVPWKEGLTLRPVRSQLGLRAFGAAGFVGREPGDLVVEPHVNRGAAAIEADTAVLAFGGPPTFEPAGHEYMARVRGAVNRPEEALAIARDPELRREAESDAPLLS